MKAPDKIYLPESNKVSGEVAGNFFKETPFVQYGSILYIRKDALLEWAKEHKVELLDSAKTMDTDSVGKCINSGALTMLDNVIDKIESL